MIYTRFLKSTNYGALAQLPKDFYVRKLSGFATILVLLVSTK